MKSHHLIIEDVQYYRALESEVRDAMKQFEAGLLPIAEQAVKDSGFTVKDHPKEGYYHETKELSRYFDCIRTLQEQYTDKVTSAIKHLHAVYTHPIFGLKQGVRTALNPTDVYYPLLDPVTISPAVDAVTIATQRLAPSNTLPNWTTENIMQEVEKIPKGTCLVGLAALVDKLHKEKGKYNPVATCMARETTVLSAMKWAVVTSVHQPPTIDWRVTSEVEAYGKTVIDGYNDLIEKHFPLWRSDRRSRGAREVTPDNVESILENAPDILRCVNLSNHDKVGFYHWTIVETNGKYCVSDFYAPQIATTQEYQDNPQGFLKKYGLKR